MKYGGGGGGSPPVLSLRAAAGRSSVSAGGGGDPAPFTLQPAALVIHTGIMNRPVIRRKRPLVMEAEKTVPFKYGADGTMCYSYRAVCFPLISLGSTPLPARRPPGSGPCPMGFCVESLNGEVENLPLSDLAHSVGLA